MKIFNGGLVGKMIAKQKYQLTIKKTVITTIEVEAQSAKKAKKTWERKEKQRLLESQENIKEEIVAISVIGKETPEGETDVHTEHCCLTCGCKYASKNCSVVTEKKVQSYPHYGDERCEMW